MQVLGVFNTVKDLYFPLVDNGTTDFEATPVTIATGDSKVSIDGGSFTNTTNNFAHVGGGSYSLQLTAVEMQGTQIVVSIIDQTGTKEWDDQQIQVFTGLGGQITANKAIYVIACDNSTFSPTTTSAEFTMVSPHLVEEATASHFVGRLLSGADGVTQAGMTDITASSLDNSKILLTYTALQDAPANGAIMVIQ